MNPILPWPSGTRERWNWAPLARLRLERVHGVDRGADLLAGEHLRGVPRLIGVERQELDDSVLDADGDVDEQDLQAFGLASDVEQAHFRIRD